jgi:CubicO group peptidase (beta-lactamase class C family)
MRRLLLSLIVVFTALNIQAQDFKLLELESAVVDFLQTDTESDAETFKSDWVLNSAAELSIGRLIEIREELKPFLGDLGIEGTNTGLVFYLSSPAGERKLSIGISGVRITSLEVSANETSLKLTSQNIEAVFDSLEEAGYAGLIFAEKEGDTVIEKPFGLANKNLGTQNSMNTIFGIGSRPIDYTIAGIMLLDQQDRLDINDTITSFFDEIPEDKQSMTLRHLMTGQSGFPDFFDMEGDWDPDLQWVNREEAEYRLLNISLLFEPGTSEEHSHAAFGLLAAVIERVSGMNYYEFLKTNFFDPADMTRTGEYGSALGYSFDEFAEGGGPEFVGTPNIPPNWGPTSWLIKGSGGMYSSLGDLQKFYALMRSGEVLDEEHNQYFFGESVNLDGSMRGFELFTISSPSRQTSMYLFLNNIPDREGMREIFRALERFIFD